MGFQWKEGTGLAVFQAILGQIIAELNQQNSLLVRECLDDGAENYQQCLRTEECHFSPESGGSHHCRKASC